MQVLVDEDGYRKRLYRPRINREESSLNVSIFIPESSTNTGLYDVEPVDHLTGNQKQGSFKQQVDSARYWWDLKPLEYVKTSNTYNINSGREVPDVYKNPQNTYQEKYAVKPGSEEITKTYGFGKM